MLIKQGLKTGHAIVSSPPDKNEMTVGTNARKNITSDKMKELSKEQLKLKLERESCQNSEKRKAIQNNRNRVKNRLIITSKRKRK